MKSLFVRFVREDEGQDLIEYALLCTVIAMVVFIGAQVTGNSLLDWYNAIGAKIEGWVGLV
jgi:Flp pilus assembly pilin Flp